MVVLVLVLEGGKIWWNVKFVRKFGIAESGRKILGRGFLLLIWLCTLARWHFLIGWSILSRSNRQSRWSASVPHLTLVASFRVCFFFLWPTSLSP
jgi:hypothetical protein